MAEKTKGDAQRSPEIVKVAIKISTPRMVVVDDAVFKWGEQAEVDPAKADELIGRGLAEKA